MDSLKLQVPNCAKEMLKKSQISSWIVQARTINVIFHEKRLNPMFRFFSLTPLSTFGLKFYKYLHCELSFQLAIKGQHKCKLAMCHIKDGIRIPPVTSPCTACKRSTPLTDTVQRCEAINVVFQDKIDK